MAADAAAQGEAGSSADSAPTAPLDSGSPVVLDGAADAPDASAGPPLVAGAGIAIRGVTTDGFIIYTQGATMSAIPLAGGEPIVINSNDGVNDVADPRVFGKDVLYFDGSGGTYQVGLSIWTKEHGSQSLHSGYVHLYFASPDGSKVFWADNEDGTTTVADLHVASADGTASTVLGQAPLSAARAWFTSKGDLLLQGGDLIDGGVSPRQHVTLFPDAGLPARQVASPVYYPAVSDPSGTWLWAAIDGATWKLADIQTGQSTVFSGETAWPSSAFFDATGSAAFLGGSSGDVTRVETANPDAGAVSLVATGFEQSLGISPDGTSLLYGAQCTYATPTTPSFCALRLAPTTLSNTGHITVRAVADAVEHGDPFTADSSRALFVVPGDPQAWAPEPLYAVATDGNGSQVTISPAVWVKKTLASALGGWEGWGGRYAALTGPRVLLAEAEPPLDAPASISLSIANAAGASPTRVLASGVDPAGFFLSADRTQVAYVGAGAQPGLYVASTR